MNDIVEYVKDDVGFYPTPPEVVDKMLAKIDWDIVSTFLEPSAGKGNIVDGIINKAYIRRGGYRDDTGISVDCIEIDPHLRGIIEYEFGGTKRKELYGKYRDIDDNTSYSSRTEEQKREMADLKTKVEVLERTPVRIVSDDFLSFKTHKRYDAIVMNPPFSNGDEHLLHAIEIQRNGGAIVCLLNAETIRNPYTKTRKLLKSKLEKYQAEIQYISGGFVHAERKTGVEIALIYVVIPQKENTSFIFEGMKKAKEQKTAENEATEITSGDFLQSIVEQFNFEVEGTLRLIREYEAIKPYMKSSFEDDSMGAILTLSLEKSGHNYEQIVNVNAYLKIVRLKYWRALFRNKEFTGSLTKNLYEKYYNILESMGDYDFTMYNILTFHKKMMAELSAGVQDTILALFEKLSEEHSWYPECGGNIHYFNGWATNKAHMINTKKVIIPTYGVYSTYSWSSKEFNELAAFDTLSDIEKVFNYLDTGNTTGPDMMNQLKIYSESRTAKKIPLKYFFVTFYKKGTCHIEWRVPDLVDKLNIYGCQRKNWLPPCYGKKHYSDMTPEEKTVIDEFQGKDEYEKVVSNASFYLVSANQLLQLPGEMEEKKDG